MKREPVRLWQHVLGGSIVIGLLGVAASAYVRYPLLLLAIIPAVLMLFVQDRRRARIVGERSRDDIGTFARAFDRRSAAFDPRILRATWDALTEFPLRPSDDLRTLHGLDCHGIDEVIVEVADRAGRRLDDTSANPFRGRVRTVRDLVEFVAVQPRA